MMGGPLIEVSVYWIAGTMFIFGGVVGVIIGAMIGYSIGKEP